MGDYNNPDENNNDQQPNNQNADQPQNQQNQQPLYQQPLYQQPQYQQPQYQQPQYQQNQQPLYQQPQYQQPQYQQPQYQQPDPNQNQYQQSYPQFQEQVLVKKSNGMAIGSMVCGIVGFLFSCCIPYLSIPIAIVSIVLGIISLKNKRDGKGMAIVGIVLAGITLIVSLLVIIGIAALLGNESFMNEFYEGFNEGLEAN